MLRKYLLFPFVIAIACTLGAANDAMAQRYRGRAGVYGNYGWRGGYYSRSPYYRNYSYYRPYYGNYYYRPYYRNYSYYRPNYGNYYRSWYPYSYGYTYPYSSYNYYPYTSSYTYPYAAYNPVAPSYGNTAVASDNRASIEVTVPDPNAKVWFDNRLTTATGTDRWYQTAPLTGSGTYHLHAQWQQNGRTITQDKNVTVIPNGSAVVHFAANGTY